MPPPRVISFDRDSGEAVIETETGERITASAYDSPAVAELIASSGVDPSGAPDAAEQFMSGSMPAQPGLDISTTPGPEFGFPGFPGDEVPYPDAHPGGALPPGPALPIPGAPTPLREPGITTVRPETTTSRLGDLVAQQEADVAAARAELAQLGSDGRPVTSLVAPGTGGTPAAPGAAPASGTTAPRRGGGGGRPAAPAAPPDLVTELTQRGEGQLVPGDSRGSSPLDTQLGLLDERRRMAQDLATQRAGAAIDRQDILEGALQQRQEIEQERQRAIGQARDRYRRALDRVQGMEVDPGRWFSDRGAIGIIGSAIAVGLGAVGQGLGGSATNTALDIIQRTIDRDIDAQRANIDNAQQNLGAEAGLVDMMRQEFQDRDAAEAAARAIMLEQAAQRVGQFEAEFQGQEAGIAAREMREQLMQQSAAAQQEAEQQAVDRALERARVLVELRRADAEATVAERRAARIGTGAGGAGGRVREEAYRIFRAQLEGGSTLEEARAAAIQAGMPPDVAATLTHAPITGEGRARIDAFDAAVRGLESELDSYDVRGEAPAGVGLGAEFVSSLPFGEFLLSPEGRRMRQMRDNVVDAFVRARSGAQTSPGEYENLLHIVRGAGTAEELRTGIEMMREAIRAMLGRTGRGESASEERVARDESFGAEARSE